jgi:hypothetical protein
MIKDESGPLARALHRAETSHSQPLQIRCFDGTKIEEDLAQRVTRRVSLGVELEESTAR